MSFASDTKSELLSIKADNCCNRTRVFIDEVHQVFVAAWNYLVDNFEEILVDHLKVNDDFKQIINALEQSFENEEQSNIFSEESFEDEEQSNNASDHPHDVLKAYRLRELKQLLEIGKISEINPEIVRRTLDHIIVKDDGGIIVVFLSGTVVEV